MTCSLLGREGNLHLCDGEKLRGENSSGSSFIWTWLQLGQRQ